MNIHVRRRNDTFIRIRQFGLDNAVDFPAGSVGKQQFAEIAAVVDLIEQLAGAQAQGRGGARFAFHGKGTARENLREAVSEIADIARSMVYEFPGIDLKFRVPRNVTDAELLAIANAFLAEALPYQADFVRYGLAAAFMTDLQADIEAYEESLGAPGTATDAHVEATEELDAAVRRGMIARRISDGVVRLKYKNDSGKLAAWTSASHIEKAPEKKKKDEPPNPPNP
ncbi:MAG TPA: hypothetical protein VF604_17315 [Pyrinomonadaceae bacterium]|jgi:hypothetical protein